MYAGGTNHDPAPCSSFAAVPGSRCLDLSFARRNLLRAAGRKRSGGGKESPDGLQDSAPHLARAEPRRWRGARTGHVSRRGAAGRAIQCRRIGDAGRGRRERPAHRGAARAGGDPRRQRGQPCPGHLSLPQSPYFRADVPRTRAGAQGAAKLERRRPTVQLRGAEPGTGPWPVPGRARGKLRFQPVYAGPVLPRLGPHAAGAPDGRRRILGGHPRLIFRGGRDTQLAVDRQQHELDRRRNLRARVDERS